MKRFVPVILLLAAPLVPAGERAAGPEQLGARWARLTDRMQIELLIDAARAPAFYEAARLVRTRAAGIVSGESNTVSLKAAPDLTGSSFSVVVDGNNARVAFDPENRVVLEKNNGRWKVVEGVIPSAGLAVATERNGVSVGRSFVPTPVNRDFGIDRLTRAVTRDHLDRALFGLPDRTASYYMVRYTSDAPFVEATYVQFVSDPGWDRILYGNMYRWIRVLDDVRSPSGLTVDGAGRVFVGEEGRHRIRVLRLEGTGDDLLLYPAYTIDGIAAPADLAVSDAGTPHDVTDDVLYVADPSQNVVLRYTLGPSSAVLSARWTGFDGPTRLAVGRWNGASNSLLYVVDGLAKRVRVFEDDKGSLSLLAEHRADHRRYYSAITTDHFGQVYLADAVGSAITKYTAGMEPLDEDGGDGSYASIASIAVPFGRIEVEGDGTYWAGFDQIFGVERWGEESGVQRRTLGLRIADIVVTSEGDGSKVVPSFTLTDPGQVRVKVMDERGGVVRTVEGGWMVSGRKRMEWDRRTNGGMQVAGGTYLFELSAVSAYNETPVVSTTRLQLPLYYDVRCGSSIAGDDPFRVQGDPVRWGARTAVAHEHSVVYRFTGLNPSSSYSLEAWFELDDAVQRVQDVRADGVVIAGPLQIGSGRDFTGVLAIPRETTADGALSVSVHRLGEGTAVVTRLVLKETGVSFGATPQEQAIPDAYTLEQNFPNPFNPATVIRYALPEPARVVLTVFDISGREVAVLDHGEKPAGVHEVRFDAETLASGVYLYRLRAGTFMQVRKMVMLK